MAEDDSVNCPTDRAYISLYCCDICRDLWLGNSSPGLTVEERQFHNSQHTNSVRHAHWAFCRELEMNQPRDELAGWSVLPLMP